MFDLGAIDEEAGIFPKKLIGTGLIMQFYPGAAPAAWDIFLNEFLDRAPLLATRLHGIDADLPLVRAFGFDR